MSELLLTAILAILVLMVFVSGALILLLWPWKPEGWSLAKRFAGQILRGEVPEELVNFAASGRECQNCGGTARRPRWAMGDAHQHLRKTVLAKALVEQNLCLTCLKALSKLAPAPKAPADAAKKDEKKSPTLARYFVKGLSAVGFAVALIFALNFAFSALVPSETVRATGVFGMIHSFGAFVIAIVLGGIALVLLRQLMK